MGKNYLKNKKITVMGLGLIGGGVDVVNFLVKSGARVLVTDLRTEKELKDSLNKIKGLPITLVLGKHRIEDFKNADLIIRNPGVPDDSPFLKIAQKNNIPVETDIGIFFELCKTPIIGITGTKGKSTTASLIYHIFKKEYSNVVLAGNIGRSPLADLDRINQNTKVILELSSWQLEGLKKKQKSPNIAVITAIYRDHLNRYRNFKDYIEAKKLIFRFQKPKDVLVLNYDNPILKDFYRSATSKVYFFSQNILPNSLQAACFLKRDELFFNNEKRAICSIAKIRLKGEHNISNILAAVSVAKIGKISSTSIAKSLKSFEGISWRQELVQKVRGVRYFNDTTATIPEATQAAIRTMRKNFPDSKIVLIAGGQDKNLVYRNLAKEIEKGIDYLILLPGTASEKIKKALISRKKFPQKFLFLVQSMEEAVKKSSLFAKKGDIVVLSPAAASFNLFKNEFDRGKHFNILVKKLKK